MTHPRPQHHSFPDDPIPPTHPRTHPTHLSIHELIHHRMTHHPVFPSIHYMNVSNCNYMTHPSIHDSSTYVPSHPRPTVPLIHRTHARPVRPRMHDPCLVQLRSRRRRRRRRDHRLRRARGVADPGVRAAGRRAVRARVAGPDGAGRFFSPHFSFFLCSFDSIDSGLGLEFDMLINGAVGLGTVPPIITRVPHAWYSTFFGPPMHGAKWGTRYCQVYEPSHLEKYQREKKKEKKRTEKK